MTCSKYHPSGDWFYQSSNVIVKDFPESNSNLRKRKQKENLFPNNSLKCNLKVTQMVCVANARNLRLSLEGPLPKLRYVSPSPAIFLLMPVLKVYVKTCFSDTSDTFPNHVTTRLKMTLAVTPTPCSFYFIPSLSFLSTCTKPQLCLILDHAEILSCVRVKGPVFPELRPLKA